MSFFDMIQSFDTSVLEFIQNAFKCSFLDPIMAFSAIWVKWDFSGLQSALCL